MSVLTSQLTKQVLDFKNNGATELKLASSSSALTLSGVSDADCKISGLAQPTANTDAANKVYVDTQISNLIDGSNVNLDTLSELAQAINNDANAFTTLTQGYVNGDAATLASAQSYTDTAEADAISTSNNYTDTREVAITTAYTNFVQTAQTDLETGNTSFSGNKTYSGTHTSTNTTASTSTTTGCMTLAGGLGVAGSVYVGGDQYATSYTSTSDRRLKKNIEDICEEEADKILKLRPVNFNWKKNNISSCGLIAQECEQVFPNAVSAIDEQHYGVNYQYLIPLLIKKLQMMQDKINDLC